MDAVRKESTTFGMQMDGPGRGVYGRAGEMYGMAYENKFSS